MLEKVKKILNLIWNILNSRIFIYIVLGIFIFFLIKSCNNTNDLKIEKKKTEQNLLAAKDSIRLEKLKNNSLQASIYGYVATEKELKDLNLSLYNKVKEQDGKVISLSEMVFKLKQDNSILKKYADSLNYVLLNPIQIDSNKFMIPFELKYNYGDNNYDYLKGGTKVGIINNGKGISNLGTELSLRETQINLTFGEKVEDGKLRIFAQTKYPGFTPQSLQGVLIDPNTNPYIKSLIKKKKYFPNTFSLGIQSGAGYNILSEKYGFSFGVGIQYNLFTW